MKKICLLLVLGLAIILPGCKLIVGKIYGLKNPEFETEESLMSFQQKTGLDTIPYLGVNYSSWEKNELLSFPEVFVFNGEGKYIPYKDSAHANCNGPADIFLAQLDNKANYSYSDEYTLHSFSDKLEDPQCNPVSVSPSTEYDFYVFITYAIFGGKKLLKEKTLIWLDSLKHNTHIRYKLIMVNQDLKACWSEEQKKKLESYFR